MRRQIEIHAQLRHPNILRQFGNFQDASSFFFILEYESKGTLHKELHSQPDKRFDEKRTAGYIISLTNGLNYLHEQHTVQRNITPENLLLGRKCELKIAGFTWSVRCSNSEN